MPGPLFKDGGTLYPPRVSLGSGGIGRAKLPVPPDKDPSLLERARRWLKKIVDGN